MFAGLPFIYHSFMILLNRNFGINAMRNAYFHHFHSINYMYKIGLKNTLARLITLFWLLLHLCVTLISYATLLLNC